MNYFDCKKLKRMMDSQILTVRTLKEEMRSHRGCTGNMSDAIETEEKRLRELQRRIFEMIRAIPDAYIRKIMYLKIWRGMTWNRIAVKLGGINSGDGIRKMCVRYRW